MKKILTLFLIFSSLAVVAQLKIPRPSSKSFITQNIGYTEIQVEYSRPEKKGRKIFGDLVPYNEIWRTGADKNTIISFSQEVFIEGKKLPKGKYALYAKPNPKYWTIYFYKNTESWGLPSQWNETDIALEINVKPYSYPIDNEIFTIEVSPKGIFEGNLHLRWEKTAVNIPLSTLTIEQVLENITQNLNEKSSSDDYYDAALFLLNAEKNYSQALSYINTSIAKDGEAPHYSLWLKALILNKLGDKKEAIKHSEASLKKAQELNNESYIRLNKKLLSQWKK